MYVVSAKWLATLALSVFKLMLNHMDIPWVGGSGALPGSVDTPHDRVTWLSLMALPELPGTVLPRVPRPPEGALPASCLVGYATAAPAFCPRVRGNAFAVALASCGPGRATVSRAAPSQSSRVSLAPDT